MLKEPNCSKMRCKHFMGVKNDGDERTERLYCKVYPDGIPEEKAYGDCEHGICFVMELTEEDENWLAEGRKKMEVTKREIGLAGKYAVNSELLRRGIATELTPGERGNDIRIVTRAKRGREWPNCQGVFGERAFLIFVDFANRRLDQRPDFYILDSQDWLRAVKERIEMYKARGGDKARFKNVTINEENVPVWHDEIKSDGKPYTGCGILVENIEEHKERWDKIR